MTTADQVLGATGLLAEFNTAGVLAPADVHTARLIGDLWAEPDESVRLAIALAVRALRSGSVCLDITRLAEQAIATLEEVPDALSWPDPADWVAAIQRSRPSRRPRAEAPPASRCVSSTLCFIWSGGGAPRRWCVTSSNSGRSRQCLSRPCRGFGANWMPCSMMRPCPPLNHPTSGWPRP